MATSGRPVGLDAEEGVAQALVVVDHVEFVVPLEQEPRTRRLNVRGSGNPAVHMVASSSRSMGP